MSVKMPDTDAAVLGRRAQIVKTLRAIVPGEGVIDREREMKPFESDGLTAYRQLPMVVVHNEGARPLGPEAADILRRYPAKHKFVVSALPGPVANILDDPSLSLWRFLHAPPTNMSIVVRAALKSWIVPIFTQFKSFELRRDLESSDYLR